MRLLAAQAEIVRAQAEDGAVVDHHPVLVAPQRVGDAAGAKLAQVAGDQAVHDAFGIGAADAELAHGRDVEQRRLVADGEVLGLDRFEMVGRGVAGPGLPGAR